MKTKRLLSVLLAVCMLVSMSAAAGLVANAEDNTPVIEVSNVPEAEVGKTPVEGSVDVPEGAKYIAEVQWYVMEDWDGHPTSASFNGTFTKGYTYRREITISLADDWEGWQYVDTYGEVLCDIVINGEYAGVVLAYEEDGKASHEDFFHFTEKIESAEVTGVVDAVAGAQATTDGIKVPADANYTVKAQWYTYDERVEFSGTFVKGEIYGLELTLIAAEGYSFDDECVVKVNGEEQESFMSVQKMHMDVYLEYNLSENINVVEITNTEKAVVGQEPSVDGVSVSENANYTVAAQWFMYDEEQGAVLVTDEFAKGNVYYLMIFVEANDGYKFAEDAVIKMNGATLAEDYYYIEDGQVIIVLEGGQNPIEDNNPDPGNTSTQNNTITKAPATGDTNMMFPMVALLILSVVGIVVVLELKKREYDI